MRNVFSSISLSANTVAERVVELSKELEEQLCKKGKAFSTYSITLDESTYLGDICENMPLSEFEDTKWMMDLAFLVDITQELNNPNLKLQGPGQLVTWKNQISQSNHTDFPSCKSLLEELDIKIQFSDAEYSAKLDLHLEEFDQRLQISESKEMALFSSTSICENLFSTMNINKSKYRTKLCDTHLAAILKVSTAQSEAKHQQTHRTEALPGVWQTLKKSLVKSLALQ
ncbi:GTD2B protein, partial [Polyodon spathula]|nr:GTD2B protein [Polyodon spathula]